MEFYLYKSELKVRLDGTEPIIFKKILDKDPVKGIKAMLYIFFACDESKNNPIKDVPFNEREEHALLNAFGSKTYNIQSLGTDWYTLITNGKEAYKKEIVKDEAKDLAVYDKKLDQFRTMLAATIPTIERNINKDGSITFSTNIDIINGVLANVVSLINTKASLVSMYLNGDASKVTRSGLSPLSRGEFKEEIYSINTITEDNEHNQ